MPLDKPLTEVTLADLTGLIANGEAEQKIIDYKEAMPLDTDYSKNELRKDVTSFANSVGGHLIIGMQEDKGYPIKLCGHDVPDEEKFRLHIDAILQNKISPRIPSYGIHFVPLNDGTNKVATVIRIGRSFVKPHQITLNTDDFQFWARSSAGKYRLTVDELRTVIIRSESVADQIRRFRMDRIANVLSDDLPVPIKSGARIVLHMVPLGAFDPGVKYDLTRMTDTDWFTYMGTLADGHGIPNRRRHNLDGFIGYVSEKDGAPNVSYSQIFKNGILEAVDAYWLGTDSSRPNPQWFPAANIAIRTYIERGLSLQQRLGVPPPIAIMLTVAGGSNCTIFMNPCSPHRFVDTYSFGKNVVMVSEYVVDDFTTDPNIVLKHLLDEVWNAGGFSKCQHFDPKGKYINEIY